MTFFEGTYNLCHPCVAIVEIHFQLDYNNSFHRPVFCWFLLRVHRLITYQSSRYLAGVGWFEDDDFQPPARLRAVSSMITNQYPERGAAFD